MAMQQALPILPMGFRFYPIEEELVVNYLQKRAARQLCPIPIIANVDIYNFNPWKLPSMALFEKHEWYFFMLCDHRYPNSVHPSRSATTGFWKAISTDKLIQVAGVLDTPIAMKKALVFYVGRPPMETKTTWIMYEYRLTNTRGSSSSSSTLDPSVRLDEWVLCKIFNKAPVPEPDNTPLSNASRFEATPASTMNNGDMFNGAGNMLFTIQEDREETSSNQLSVLRHHQSQAVPPIPMENSFNGTAAVAAAAAAAGDHGWLEEEDTSAYTFSDQEMEQMLMDLMDQDFFGEVG